MKVVSPPPENSLIPTPPSPTFPLMHLRGALGVFIISLFLCLLTCGGHLYSPDEEIMFRLTESIATRARLDVAPIAGPDGDGFATRKGLNNLEYPQYGIGNSLAAVPFYWLGAAACKIIPAETASRLLDFETQLYAREGMARGHDLLKRFAVSFTGSFIAALTAALIYMFCRRLTAPAAASLSARQHPVPNNINPSDSAAPTITAVSTSSAASTNFACWAVALAYIAGTMALPHARTFFSEPLATLFVLTTFYILYANSARPLSNRRALAAGTVMALAFLTRLDSLFAAPGIALLLLWTLPTSPSTAARPAPAQPHSPLHHAVRWLRRRINTAALLRLTAFAIPSLVFLAWQLTLNALRFGDPLSSAYADQPEGINFSTPVIAGIYGFLFSIGKSIILFSPALLLSIFGLARFYRQHPILTVALFASAVSVLVVHASWQNWAGGWCWGPRHIFMIHALLILPALGFLSIPTPPRRWIAEGVILAGFIVQVYGSSQSFIDYYVLYYRTPYSAPNARVMYGAEDIAPSFIQATAVGPDGKVVPYPILALPAPINDSIYVPQNSQWYRYAEMWNSGYTDNLWLRLLQRSIAKEQPVL